MTVEHLLGESQLPAHFTDLVLVKEAERLDNAVRFQQAADSGDAVMVRLDDGSLLRPAGLNGVGIDRALSQDPVFVQEMMRVDDPVLDPDEFFADNLALLFRVMDTL